MGGTVPYMQVLAKDFGINSTVVGIIYTIVPLCVCLSKPMFGFITDKLQNIKAVLLLILLVTAVSFFAILFVPPIKNINMEVRTECRGHITELIITPSIHNYFYPKESSDKQFDCNFASSCFKNQTLAGILIVSNPVGNKSVPGAFTFKISNSEIPKYNCDCLEQSVSHLVCEADFYNSVFFENSKSVSYYEKYNFWVFVLLSVISGTGSATTYCLSDAACYEVVRHKPQEYGRQRLWGTISWGLATLVTGYLNDIATGGSKTTNYSPGFYLMLVFVLVDILILSRVQLKKANISTNICKDVGTIFSSWKTAVFAFGVYVSGAMSGLLWTYEFWYLTELGSSQLLLGLVAGVQCLVTEVPFFFFSGWFIKKFRHFYCLIASIAAFALRLGLYTILHNPWMVLPIEVLHGITYAVFCAAMTLYAVECAPPGTEATMLGILGGIFEGLGNVTNIQFSNYNDIVFYIKVKC